MASACTVSRRCDTTESTTRSPTGGATPTRVSRLRQPKPFALEERTTRFELCAKSLQPCWASEGDGTRLNSDISTLRIPHIAQPFSRPISRRVAPRRPLVRVSDDSTHLESPRGLRERENAGFSQQATWRCRPSSHQTIRTQNQASELPTKVRDKEGVRHEPRPSLRQVLTHANDFRSRSNEKQSGFVTVAKFGSEVEHG